MTRKQRQQAKTFAKDLAGFAVFALLILNAPDIIQAMAEATAVFMGVK